MLRTQWAGLTTCAGCLLIAIGLSGVTGPRRSLVSATEYTVYLINGGRDDKVQNSMNTSLLELVDVPPGQHLSDIQRQWWHKNPSNPLLLLSRQRYASAVAEDHL